MSNSTRRSKKKQSTGQTAKPYDGFPLTAHPSGRWCKKIAGKLHYFGKIADGWQPALEAWERKKDDLLAGRVPRDEQAQGNTLRDLVIAFLRHKQDLLNTGELSPRTFQDCHRTCRGLVDHFGKTRLLDDFRPEDFAAYRNVLAQHLGPVSLGNEIQKTRGVFKFGRESGMIKTDIIYGPGFKRPSKKTLRIERAKKGPKMFERDELRRLLGIAGVNMRAMILLAVNAGLGNSDLANLPLSAIDLERGWIDYPRPKTGIERRFPLWPETAQAIRDVIERRPKPKSPDAEGLLFVTKYGGKWCKAIFERREVPEGQTPNDETTAYRTNNDNEVSKEFVKLFAKAKIERSKGRSFYTLRHVFETIAGESRDQIGVDAIMGHAREDMASIYRERIGDERLIAVVEHVRGWLFGADDNNKDRAE